LNRCRYCGGENPEGALFCNLCLQVFEPDAVSRPQALGSGASTGVPEAPHSDAQRGYPRAPPPEHAGPPADVYAGRFYPADTCGPTGIHAPDPCVRPIPPARSEADRQMWLMIKGAAAFTALLLAASLVYVLFFRQSTPEPLPSQGESVVIDVTADPVQFGADEGRVLYRRNGEFEIQSLASYSIQGRVLDISVNNSYEVEGSVFPVDVALAWGKIAETDYDRYMKYGFEKVPGENQWFTVTSGGASLPEGMSDDYIMTHLSNNHVLPATENLYNAIVRLEKRQEVLLEGHLVRAFLIDGNLIESSLVRDDTEGGACECLYLERLQVDDTVYE
jgi:hypothetical protein